MGKGEELPLPENSPSRPLKNRYLSCMQKIHTDKAPAAIGPYSQGIAWKGLHFFSGQIALDPNSGDMVQSSLEAEVAQVLDNVEALLKACGLDWHRVLKVSIFLTDMRDFPKVNAWYAERLGDHLPARETVEVSALPKGAKVEMSVVAAAE